ncbi:O-antigen/teichoic acid export membrane protein [Sphingomonas sp. F9_3S_D5_B_2]
MTERSLTHETMSGLFWQSTVAGANIVIRTGVLILLARTLEPTAFGLVAAALVVTTVTQVFSQIGTTQALVQRLTITDAHVRSGFAVALFTGVLAAIVIALGAPLFALLFHMPEVAVIIRVFALLLILNGIAAVPIAMLQREKRFKKLSLIELIAFSSGYGALGLILAYAGFGVWSLVIAQLAQVIIRTVLYFRASRPRISLVPDRTAVRELYEVGSGFSAGQIGNLVATQIDYFVVGRYLGAAPLGLYNRAYQFLMLPAQLFGTAAATVLFPALASIQDQPERVARAYLRAIAVIAMLTLPLTGVCILVAPELVQVTLGARWIAMTVPFQILIASLLFRTSYKISDSLALATGAMRSRAVRQWIYAAAVGVGAVAGTPWGLNGVSAGVAVAVVLNFLMMLQLAVDLTKISWSTVIRIHVRQALAAVPVAICTGLSVAAARHFHLADWLVLIVGGAAGAVAWFAMWWRFRSVFGEEGAWAYQLAADRLAPFATKLRSSKSNAPAGSPRSQPQRPRATTQSRAEI